MRINKYVAAATGMSRRAADQAVLAGRVTRNQQPADLGDSVESGDIVALDNQRIITPVKTTTIMLNKPAGYICSRDGQGGKTVYDLLPAEYSSLKLVGRLDKNSSGLILLTNDGQLANQLTHPRYSKTKVYNVSLGSALAPLHQQMISDHGVRLDDGISQLALMKHDEIGKQWQITMAEGRNRQIRRTFAALGYGITKLHRTNFGSYELNDLGLGQLRETN